MQWVGKAVGGNPGRSLDADECRKALRLLVDPEAAVELRALPSGRHCVHAGGAIETLVAEAERYLAGGEQVYFGLNPVPVTLTHATRKEDVLRRRWLLIDVDPIKSPEHKDHSATQAEKEAARDVMATVHDHLTGLGWPAPLMVDSGNGFHLLYRLDLPSDDETQKALRALIHSLAEQFDTATAQVDRSVHNASRVSKLPGGWSMKGPSSDERPWRPVKLLHVPATVEIVTIEQIKAATKTTPAAAPPANAPYFQWRGRAVDGDNGAAYAQAALDGEVRRVALASLGGRNNALNDAAFRLGTLVGGGALQRDAVEGALTAAAERVGLAVDPNCGEQGIAATIRSGLEAGMKKPRKPPERDAGGPGKVPTKEEVKAKFLPSIYRLTDLLLMEFPAPRWAVPGIMSEGLSILAGKPKLGKSWMALNLGITIASGGTALGMAKVTEGDVLYLSLEDRLRRVQDRARKLIAGGVTPSHRMSVSVEWPKLDAGGLDHMEKWIEEADDPRLIVIDIWAKFRPSYRPGSQYEQDYEAASALKSMGDKYGVSMLILHHCKKAAAEDVVDEVSGTLGLAGAADGLMVLTRSRSETEGKLFITGRDVEEQHLAIEFNPQSFAWKSMGDAKLCEGSRIKVAILDVFKKSPGSTYFPSQMAHLLNANPETVRSTMWRMEQEGILKRVGNKYSWPIEEMAPAQTQEF